jgi:hypothetical protein
MLKKCKTGVDASRFQIDNQLYGCLDPIILYPTVIPKAEKDEHPVLQAAAVRSQDFCKLLQD